MLREHPLGVAAGEGVEEGAPEQGQERAEGPGLAVLILVALAIQAATRARKEIYFNMSTSKHLMYYLYKQNLQSFRRATELY